MAKLPEYVKKAIVEKGRSFISGIDNPRRRCTDSVRAFKVVGKSWDESPEFNDNFETPWIYEVIEIAGLDEHIVNTFEFSTGKNDLMYLKLKALGEK